ncbi:MAG: hypothetical protein ABWY55_06265 [Microbacterium sp.]
MTSPLSRLGVALVLTATAILATACASPAPDPDSTATTAPTPSASSPEPEPTATEAPVASDDPTCETIIPASTVADFESIGWSAQADRFYVGELELSEGLQCVWADFEGPAGDHIQLFGWSLISDTDAAAAQASLEGQGWVREESPEGVIITENPETTIAVDDQGYGMTYLFGDGWVKVADTKQGLILIEWPRA